MDSLFSKLDAQTVVTSSPDVFFEYFARNPFELVTAAPDIYKNVVLLQGLWGTLGSVISVTYIEDGNIKNAEGLVAALDENEKLIKYEVIAGDLLGLFTAISITFQAGTKDGKNIVTWTIEYVKILPVTPAPTSLLNLLVTATKEIDAKNSK